MPKPQSSNPNDRSPFKAPRSQPNWLVAVACFLFGMLLAVAFLSYSPEQSRFFTTNPIDRNFVELILAPPRRGSRPFSAWGRAAWLVPLFLFWLLYLALRSPRQLVVSRLIAMILGLAAASGLAAMFFESLNSTNYFPHGPGGLIGQLIYRGGLRDMLGGFGTVFLLGTVYLCCLLFIFTKDIGAEVEKIAAQFSAWWSGIREEESAGRAAGSPGGGAPEIEEAGARSARAGADRTGE